MSAARVRYRQELREASAERVSVPDVSLFRAGNYREGAKRCDSS